MSEHCLSRKSGDAPDLQVVQMNDTQLVPQRANAYIKGLDTGFCVLDAFVAGGVVFVGNAAAGPALGMYRHPLHKVVAIVDRILQRLIKTLAEMGKTCRDIGLTDWNEREIKLSPTSLGQRRLRRPDSRGPAASVMRVEALHTMAMIINQAHAHGILHARERRWAQQCLRVVGMAGGGGLASFIRGKMGLSTTPEQALDSARLGAEAQAALESVGVGATPSVSVFDIHKDLISMLESGEATLKQRVQIHAIIARRDHTELQARQEQRKVAAVYARLQSVEARREMTEEIASQTDLRMALLKNNVHSAVVTKIQADIDSRKSKRKRLKKRRAKRSIEPILLGLMGGSEDDD